MSKPETKETIAKRLAETTTKNSAIKFDIWKTYARMKKADLIMLADCAENEGMEGFAIYKKYEEFQTKEKAKEHVKIMAEIEAKNEEHRKSQSIFYGSDLAPIIIPVLIVLFFIFLIVKCTHDAYNKPYYERGVPYGNTAVDNVRKALKKEGY